MNDDMSDEYSLREETTFRTELFRRLGMQDGILKDIKEQTTKHNGRMTTLEVKTEDYGKVKDTVNGLKAREMWVMGGIGVIMFAGAFVWNLVLKDILHTSENNMRKLIEEQKGEIAGEVVSSIEEKYDLQIIE